MVKLKAMRVLYEEKNCSYWRSAGCGNSKKLWRTFNIVLGDVSTNETGGLSADDFATFFRKNWTLSRLSTQSVLPYDVLHRSTPILDERLLSLPMRGIS